MSSAKRPFSAEAATTSYALSAASVDARRGGVVQEEVFVQQLRLERRRTERSGNPFMLILVTCRDPNGQGADILGRDVAAAVLNCTRETDVIGWYEQDAILGVLLTEVAQADETTAAAVVAKISAALKQALPADEHQKVKIVCRIFPEHAGKIQSDGSESVLYPDLSGKHEVKRGARTLKRTVDIVGSILFLLVFSPLFLCIAILVKVTSKGPILFCQKRVGRYGKIFTFFKFRSMCTGNDPRIHEEYITKLIEGGEGVQQADGSYKLLQDPRVTKVGSFLRKTSLDELPQFLNVLLGDMSLVGPRPPIPYEYHRYKTWHRRRALEIKPGITGLWQVKGRSRTTFDEMVRMDLQYAEFWSLILDLKLILQTPMAMFSGEGAR